MAFFIQIDAQNNIIGLFSDDPEYAAPPVGAVGITDQDAAPLLLGKFGEYQYLNGVIVQNAGALLLAAQNTQLALIDSSYDAAVGANIEYMNTVFQADADSRALMASVLTASGGTLPIGFSWYDASNAPIEMTFAQLQGLAAAILARGQPLFVQKQTQKAAIRAATTVAQVVAIVW